MRTLEPSSAIQRDYKRAKATPRHSKNLDVVLSTVLDLLLSDRALPPNCRDHSLIGPWSGYRECHLMPDLLLIYRKPDAVSLRLARLGSHSELFG
jgi:mRNA interferase YafQ